MGNRMLKTINNNSGMTLIETVVSMMLLGILLGGITLVFSTTQRLTKDIIEVGRVEIIATEVMAELVDDIRVARNVDLDDTAILKIETENYTALYSVDETKKILLRSYAGTEDTEQMPVLAPGYYMGYDMALSWNKVVEGVGEGSTIALNLTLTDDTGGEYARQYLVRTPGID